MNEIDFRLSGVNREDVERILSDLGLPGSAYRIDEPEFATGAEILELLIQLSNTQVSLLDLFIGYCIGKGIPISRIVSGLERPVSSLKDAADLSSEVRRDGEEKEKPKPPQ